MLLHGIPFFFSAIPDIPRVTPAPHLRWFGITISHDPWIMVVVCCCNDPLWETTTLLIIHHHHTSTVQSQEMSQEILLGKLPFAFKVPVWAIRLTQPFEPRHQDRQTASPRRISNSEKDWTHHDGVGLKGLVTVADWFSKFNKHVCVNRYV